MTVYDLMGEREISEYGEELHTEFERLSEGLEMFSHRQFREAQGVFQRLAQAVGDSKRGTGYVMLSEVSARYSEQPLEDDWDGTIKLTSK